MNEHEASDPGLKALFAGLRAKLKKADVALVTPRINTYLDTGSSVKPILFHSKKDFIYSLEDFEPEEVARQLAIIGFDLWSLVSEREALRYIKSKRKLEDCPNISLLVDRYALIHERED